MRQKPNNDYSQALDFLYSFIDYERDHKWSYDSGHFNLDRVRTFFEALGNPHCHGWFVHIAGTNGKGSVAAMIANSLSSEGFCTGLYTSPHLVSFLERIRIDGRMITPEELVEDVNRIRSVTERFPGLTFFDVWTGLAFDYFAHSSVDVSVIEVGMGGRLDSTNVITPAISVITSISIDHRGKLGDTLSEIALEKSGVIKHGIPVVSAPQEPEVLNVLEEKANEIGTTLTLVGRDIKFHQINNGIYYSGLLWDFDRVKVPLTGNVQSLNAAVALASLEILASCGYNIDPGSARTGIETVQWPGRLQIIAKEPYVIVDGACNPEAMSAVCEFVSSIMPRDKTIAVVGMCKDKEVKQVLGILAETATKFVFTRVENPRAMNVEEMAELSPESVETWLEQDSKDAVEKAVSLAGRYGLVLVTGSLYLVGEVLKCYGIMVPCTYDVTH
ncbi:bifunctional folylpolyglutamate synthase/dihydrofolate synthase [Candidatus Latescibacterota bacterium]